MERNERQTWQQRAPGWGRGAGKSTRLFDNPFVLGFGLSLIPSNTTAIRINTHLNSNCDTPKLHSYSILHRRRPISVWIFLSPLLHWISQLSSKSCKGFLSSLIIMLIFLEFVHCSISPYRVRCLSHQLSFNLVFWSVKGGIRLRFLIVNLLNYR